MASRLRSRRPARKVSIHSSKRIAWTLAQSNKKQQQQQQHKNRPLRCCGRQCAEVRPQAGARSHWEQSGGMKVRASLGRQRACATGQWWEKERREQPCSFISGLVTTL